MISMCLSLLALVATEPIASRPETVSAQVEVYRGLDFATNDDKTLKLDLYMPRTINGTIPAIIVIPGGAFLAQESKKFKDEARTLAEAGFAAASIGYRGWPGDEFPAAVQDAKAAVRYVRANAARFNIDPDRIGAFGQSAGGYLTGMLAVTGGEEDLEGSGGNGDVSSRVKVAVCFSGLFDFVSGEAEGGEKEGGSIAKRAFNRLWIGGSLEDHRARWIEASPISHITPDDAPILFIHSRKDSMVPWQQSEAMYEAFRKVQPESELLLLDEGGHNIRDNRKVKGEAWSAAIAYFHKHLDN